MKKIIFIFLIVTIAGVSKSQATLDEKQAIAMLKTFYTAYMSADGNNILGGFRKKYCTPKCEKQIKQLIEETDSDPIIKAQDSAPQWAKTLLIKRDLNKPNVYTVSYHYDVIGDDQKPHKTTLTINLVVIKINGVFKVDKILE